MKINKESNLTNENIKHKVKSIIETHYSTIEKFGEIQKGKLVKKKMNIYNDEGNVVNAIEYLPDGSLEKEYTYKYDFYGNQIICLQFENTEWTELKNELNYDFYKDIGEVITSNRYFQDDVFLFGIINKYDEKGNLIESFTFRYEEENLILRNSFKYDDLGNMIETKQYSTISNDSLLFRIIFEYDSKRNIILEKKIRNDEMIIYTEINIYNQHGIIIETINELEDEIFEENNLLEPEFNNINYNMHVSNFDSNHNLIKKSIYKFDNYGNIVESTSTNMYGKLLNKHFYKYVYDNKGNWVQRTYKPYSKPSEITEREIEYFDDDLPF